MGNKMLIDAAHPEETRVVVLRGNRIEEFDFEAASKRQLRGNIYLAKVTRVEPSLQAAFIEYGGNRHGFLAFSEIHPDYYQIPVADRQQLLEDEARSAREDDDEPRGHGNGSRGNNGQGGDGNGQGGHRRSRRRRGGSAEKRAWAPRDESVSSEEVTEPAPTTDIHAAGLAEAQGDATQDDDARTEPVDAAEGGEAEALAATTVASDEAVEDDAFDTAGESDHEAEGSLSDAPVEGDGEVDAAEAESFDPDASIEPAHAGTEGEAAAPMAEGDHAAADAPDGEGAEGEPHEEEHVEQLGGDALEDVPHRVSRPRRNYKIQEVIKRRQVLLVQVVKEERGNKGAALTTYLSLAGRYSVLMPNTARGGGISRKIVDAEDRKRLKAIVQELEVPDGMGIILRTAGAARGLPEVKRDFEYLMRMWETVRETTLQSSAPTLVYEEGSLIKRSIRDLFTKDVDEVVVSGDTGYREAKDFMRLLMPGNVRNVVAWRDPQPIFAKAGAEAQLDAMFSNQVVLKSGGYLVINQTEALVAIDVNSGRSTREHNIEDTALRTNLEAADEIARQLRLRDLAGLIVVDFIDMEEGRNDRAVERRLKDALKNDRARIQIGRISHFGLLEMSRQRMRTGVLEGSTVMCPHCAGAGMVRSVSSMALHVLRLLEDSLIRSAAYNLIARTRAEVALYILNQKRANLLDLESRFGASITILSDPDMIGMVYHAIERGTEATPPHFLPFRREETAEEPVEDELDGDVEDTAGELAEETQASEAEDGSGAQADGDGRRRRRRRRRRGRDGRDREAAPGEAQSDAETLGDADQAEEDAEGEPEAIDATSEVPQPVVAAAAFSDTEIAAELPGMTTTPADAEAPAGEPAADEALAGSVAGEAAGQPSSDAAAEPPPAEAEAPRRRRTRRSTRATEAAEGSEETAEAAAPARRSRRSRRPAEPEAVVAPAADGAGGVTEEPARPAADRDVGADTAERHPPEAAASEPELPLAEPVAEAAAEQASASPEVAPDPDRPKRSGWWQRAKASFTQGS